MTAFTRSLAGNQPRLVSVPYNSPINYNDPNTYYGGASPGTLTLQKQLARSLAGSEPTAAGTIATKRVLTIRNILGDQPAATASLLAILLRRDPQEVVYIDGPYLAQAQYTSSVRP